eukprot:3402479-Pleurochrysis_carterae.AAC.2
MHALASRPTSWAAAALSAGNDSPMSSAADDERSSALCARTPTRTPTRANGAQLRMRARGRVRAGAGARATCGKPRHYSGCSYAATKEME